MDFKVVLALLLMTLLCLVSMASSVINYTHPEDGFYGHHLNDDSASVSIERNMLHEGHQVPLWMDMQALLSFKKHIKDPSGKLSKWTTENSEEVCSWYGITCRQRNPRVVAIILPGLNLTGILSPSIGSLSLLHTLNLSHHNLTGGIPPEIGQLKKLRVFDLSSHCMLLPISTSLSVDYMLTGSIPTSLYDCTSLERITLSHNNFTGSIPTEFGFLVKLKLLDLSYNSLRGRIPPTLSNCTKLSNLFLSSNYFTGTIPTVFGSLVKLEQLDLSYNSLTGIPSTLSNCTKLWTLFLSSNKFTGTLPTAFGHLIELQHINLRNNSLSGHVPLTLGNCTRLQSLIMNDNRLSGRISQSIFGSSLKIFEVSQNSLSGDLDITFPVSMVIFSVYSNNFTVCFPSSLVHCSKLKVIDLRKNRFTGEIPLCLSYPELQILNLGYNKFSGGIPLWITNLIKLVILDLSNNKFSGRIPYNLKLQGFAGRKPSPQTYQRLVNNVLYYELEIVIKGNEYLLVYVLPTNTILDLSKNNFTGEIPASIGTLGWLRLLNLSWNQLEGQIPASLGTISTLEQLDLAKNNLSGEIPQNLSKLYSLSTMNVSFNNLCGSIPEGPQLSTFDVNSFQKNKCLCGLPLQSCKEIKCFCGSHLPSHKENTTKSVECLDKKNNVKVGSLHHIDEKMSLISLRIGAITGFGGVVIVFLVWKKARDWMVPPNIPKRFYGEYRLPT